MNDISGFEKKGPVIQSVDRALNILGLLGTVDDELGVTEISKMLGLHKSTIYGLLKTLETRGYVEQNLDSCKYRLGLMLFELGNRVKNNLDLKNISDYYLEQLRKSTGETVHLAIMDSGEVVYIDKKESSESMRMVSQVGKRLPMHCSGIGKALLSHLTDSQIEEIITAKGLSKMTPNTIVDLKRLREELEVIRKQGYAIDNEEISEGLICVAAPIRNYSSEVIAAISVAGPKARINEEKLKDVKRHVLNISQIISGKLGYKC